MMNKLLIVLLVVLVTLSSLWLTTKRMENRANFKQLEAAKKQHQVLSESIEFLNIRRTELVKSDKISQLAKRNKMFIPTGEEIIIMKVN